MPLSLRTALLDSLLFILAAQFVLTEGAPSRITNVTVSKVVVQGESRLKVDWTAPQTNVTISQYQVQYRKNGTTVWSQVIRPSTTATLDHVLPGTAYNVRVRAQSDAGDGEWSEVHTETTYNRPLKVAGLSVTYSVEGGNLNVSWSTPQSDLPITEYEVEYRTRDMKQWSNHSVSPPSNSTLLTVLNAGAGYIVRVRAVSVIGAGAWSEELMRPDDGGRSCSVNCNQPTQTTTTSAPDTTQATDTTPTSTPAASDPTAAPLTGLVVPIVAVVGVLLLVLLIVGIVALVFLIRRQKRTQGEALDGDYCAQVSDDKAVPTNLEYYDAPQTFEMDAQRTSTDSLPEAQRSEPEYAYTTTTLRQFADLESPYSQEEGLYWEPATSLHGIKAQMNLKAKDSDELDPAAITLQDSLGEGEFGIVYKGVWASSPQGPLQVAVKTLHNQAKENKLKLLKEAAIMGQFSHPNVVKLYGVVDKPDKVMLIMEYLSRGDLLNHLMNCRSSLGRRKLPDQLLKFCREIADAMDYLSKKGFIHRDLAARNILLSEQYIAKIADFGLSRDMDEDHYYKSKGGMIPVKWTAPESVLYKKYSTKSDVWSYGMVMYEVWSLGHKPFEEFEINEVLRAMETGYCQPPPPGCPRNIYKLMVDCWNPEYHNRPTFEDLARELSTDSEVLLSWSQQDKATSSKALVLGATLERGKHLYQELQDKYQ